MSLVVLGENFVKFRIRLISIHLAGFFCHLDSAVRHECSLQRLVRLKTNNLFEILHGLINISGTICIYVRYNLGLHIENALMCTFFLLELLKSAPELIRSVGGACKEALISVVLGVVLLNEVTDIYAICPMSAFKAAPFFSHFHSLLV